MLSSPQGCPCYPFIAYTLQLHTLPPQLSLLTSDYQYVSIFYNFVISRMLYRQNCTICILILTFLLSIITWRFIQLVVYTNSSSTVLHFLKYQLALVFSYLNKAARDIGRHSLFNHKVSYIWNKCPGVKFLHRMIVIILVFCLLVLINDQSVSLEWYYLPNSNR